MAYTKTNWQNLPNTTTPINATNLNKIESGIKENDDKLLGNKPMGDVVVESIRSKNMFDKSTIVAGDITGSNTGNRLSSRQVLWLEVGTYTFSCNIASPYRYGILVQNTGIPPLSSATTYIYDAGWKTASNPTTTFTINTAGWVTISFSKEDSSALTPSDVIGFNYQLEEGSVATTYSPYQNLDGKDTIILTSGTLGNYFSTVDSNLVAKSGNVVQIQLRALVSTTIPNNGTFYTVPYHPRFGSANEILIGVGGEYDYNTGIKWGYVDRSGALRGESIPAGKWIHISTTFITED